MPVPVLRFYVRTQREFYDILPCAYACPDKGIQIVLAFARDYDKEGNYTNGKFFPYFDSITPQDIQTIKEAAPFPGSIKFFLSIGGRDPRFPFAVNSNSQRQIWINNATESLRRIIQDYHIDGIDVYYEYINSDALPFFPNSLASVIQNLRGGNNAIVTKASITVSYPLRDIYLQLYRICSDLIDYVVYQCFTGPSQDLVPFFHELFHNYPREKVLVGYSDHVTPDFVRTLAQLLREDTLSISKWCGNPDEP